jgi:hypothetical protein
VLAWKQQQQQQQLSSIQSAAGTVQIWEVQQVISPVAANQLHQQLGALLEAKRHLRVQQQLLLVKLVLVLVLVLLEARQQQQQQQQGQQLHL